MTETDQKTLATFSKSQLLETAQRALTKRDDERERCVKIVEKRFPQNHKHANDCPVCILLKKIVEEIRESA